MELWSVSAAERETSLLITARAELMTSSAGVNEPLRPSLMIILGTGGENTEWGEGDAILFNCQTPRQENLET